MVMTKSEGSHTENIFFCNNNGTLRGSEGDSTPKSRIANRETQSLFKETRQLLNNNNKKKNYTGVEVVEEEKGVSRLDGIKEILSNKGLGRNNSSLSIVSSSISTKSRRLVSKDGIVDIKYKNIPGISESYIPVHYLTDIFHTLIDAKWRYIILLFTLSFILSWILFGTSWFAIVKWDKNHSHRVCIDNVEDWVSAFLFSIEIQTTIGFGGRAVTSTCPEGVLLLVIQTIVGMFINCAMLGLLFAKLSRPKNRGKATLFSNKAVITIREGSYCLIFRYVDFRQRRLLDTNLRLVIVRQKLTEEGEFVPLDMADMKITLDFMQNDYTLRLFPLFPLTIIHEIDEESPLYKMSKFQLENSELEIIAILEGTVPTTGSTTQALTSYKPNDIVWGHRFKPVFNGLHIGQAINRIDLSTLHDTYEENDIPECSAEQYLSNKDNNEDCSSCEGSQSHGYQSETRSIYSINHLDFNVSKKCRNNEPDIVIDVNSEEIRNLQQLKESDA